MDKIWLKLFTFTAWVGVLFTVTGTVLCMRALVPYAESALRTAKIPTAPPITASSANPVLLPAEGGRSLANSYPEVLPTSTQPALIPPPTWTPVAALPNPTQAAPTLAPTVALQIITVATPAPITPTPFPTLTPLPTATPLPTGPLPARLRIPMIDLDVPVVPIGWETIDVGGTLQSTWAVPDWRAAGWHNTSARLGQPGNTVLNGHNTTRGEVFRDLYQLETGALILIEGDNGSTFAYRIAHVYILPEAGQPLEVRQANAQYIQPTQDERVTLVTCHPYGSTQFRLLIIAFPEALPEEIE